jgi:hypothetical protein
MHFDFDAAVTAPFRMQPGLRRLPTGAAQLTPLAPGSRHQREKLAVLSAYPARALCAAPGFDATPALAALCAHAASEHPTAFAWDGHRAHALRLGAVADAEGGVDQARAGVFGLGDEVTRCLLGLPERWRLAGLLSLAFAEDLALVDLLHGTVPWLAVCLPSHWAPEDKVGRHFSAIHAPVADNTLLLKAAPSLLALIGGDERWERFVWNVTDHPRLHAHPAHVDPERWAGGAALDRAWLRTERQTFLPCRGTGGEPLAWFTIAVQVQRLLDVLAEPRRAAALHAAIASMSPAVLAYRGLARVREPLLALLAERATAGAGTATAA